MQAVEADTVEHFELDKKIERLNLFKNLKSVGLYAYLAITWIFSVFQDGMKSQDLSSFLLEKYRKCWNVACVCPV